MLTRSTPLVGAADTAAVQRKREITRIQLLRRKLGLADDEYRDLLGNLFAGTRSSTLLDTAQRTQLIRHLTALQPRLHGIAHQPGRPALSARQKKMFSLWQQLADAGRVHERGMPALKTWVTRQTGVDRWEWLNSHQEDTVIESLKRWLARGNLAAGSVDGVKRG